MTIVPIGKVQLQEPKGTDSAYWRKLHEQLENVTQEVIGRCLEELLRTELDQHLKRKRHQRRSQEAGATDLRTKCQRCGSQKISDYRRNGSYERGLDTHYGHVHFRMPQVECQCGGSVRVAYRMLKPRQRIWEDVQVQIRQKAGLKMSLREIKAELDACLGGSLGLRTINECIRATQPGEEVWRRLPVERLPPVLVVDGIWVTVMLSNGTQRKDACGRQRSVKHGERRVVLVAQGVWPTTGRREVLGWVIAQNEDQASWSDLIALLRQKGVYMEQVQLVIGDGSPGFEALRQRQFAQTPFQRCIFHKLQNVSRDLLPPPQLSRAQARDYKKAILQQAEQVWEAEVESDARQRLRAFCLRWQAEQPAAVATLQRDFDLTLTFFCVQVDASLRGEQWPVQLLRTSSHLERENREIRSRFRRALLFHSLEGLSASLLLFFLMRKSVFLSVPNLDQFDRDLDALLDLGHHFLN